MLGGTCIFVGDDYRLLKEAEKLATSHIGCQTCYLPPEPTGDTQFSGHIQGAFNSLPQKLRCQGTQQLLVDIEVLAHTDYFIGS
jgi:hypothetical protein